MHQPIYTTMAQTCCPYSRAVHEPFPFSSCHLANKYKSYMRKLSQESLYTFNHAKDFKENRGKKVSKFSLEMSSKLKKNKQFTRFAKQLASTSSLTEMKSAISMKLIRICRSVVPDPHMYI